MQSKVTRREWFRSAAQVTAGVLVAPLLFSTQAQAGTSGLASKASVGYQDHPNGHDRCSNCEHFIPGPTKTALGSCKVVAGKISPHGYCYAYNPISS